jgi:hypothetical protein
MTQKEYNGWTNYETWLCNLWLDNDGMAECYAQDIVQDCKGEVYKVAQCIKDLIEEQTPDLGACFAADMLNAAISEVDWHSIAEHWCNDYPIETDENEAA